MVTRRRLLQSGAALTVAGLLPCISRARSAAAPQFDPSTLTSLAMSGETVCLTSTVTFQCDLDSLIKHRRPARPLVVFATISILENAGTQAPRIPSLGLASDAQDIDGILRDIDRFQTRVGRPPIGLRPRIGGWAAPLRKALFLQTGLPTVLWSADARAGSLPHLHSGAIINAAPNAGALGKTVQEIRQQGLTCTILPVAEYLSQRGACSAPVSWLASTRI